MFKVSNCAGWFGASECMRHDYTGKSLMDEERQACSWALGHIHELRMGTLVGTGRAALQTEVCQNQLAKIGMVFTKERKRGRAGVVIKRAGPSMKESKKSKVSMSEEQQCWDRKALYLGDERKLHGKARCCGG